MLKLKLNGTLSIINVQYVSAHLPNNQKSINITIITSLTPHTSVILENVTRITHAYMSIRSVDTHAISTQISIALFNAVFAWKKNECLDALSQTFM